MFMSCFVGLGYYIIVSMLGTTELLHVAMCCQSRVSCAVPHTCLSLDLWYGVT